MGRQRLNPKIKLPEMRKPPSMPTGARAFRPIPRDQQPIVQGPDDPPPGFIVPSTSVTEWICYWSLIKIFDPNGPDPRTPPFDGRWPYFSYQAFFDGGRSGPGGAVIDFMVYAAGTGRMDMGLRIQTEFFHLFASAQRHAYDEDQRNNIESSGLTLIDIYDQDILGDPSGSKAIITLKSALGMIERPNPIATGTALRASRADPIG